MKITNEENLLKFTKALKDKMSKGFEIEERNDKLPFAVLSKKGKKVNHDFNLVLSCITLGVWSFAWIYQCCVSSKEERVLIAIDEDGNTFEDKCYN
ncbi:hypothetical protein [Flavobacterium frigoris]|uniref:Uncharacterized protein n=1 Tax=Flavobacterium frigoris (strain PS1) TaxID=1086011 RepID=H7FTQ7_FLAFP|nr:hypothetical protein [Flavobacterium frigoris]EIA08048.1 hypothetical protein HJ01_02579 [Flavobacterium frigoris PS1]